MRRGTAAAGSAVFFVVTPGTVAGVVPWLISGWDLPAAWLSGVGAVRTGAGAAAVTAGLVVLVGAFARFVREGSGTPAPVAPTDRLVVGGTFRFVRNPMYVAVLAVVLGQALLFRSVGVLGYAVVLWATMAGFVLAYEEPVLTERYGEEYDEYRRHVRAWLPRATPWPGADAGVAPDHP